MTDEELELWKMWKRHEVRESIDAMLPQVAKNYLRELAGYIVDFAGDAGATDWDADLHLGDVIEKHIRRSPTLMEASDGY